MKIGDKVHVRGTVDEIGADRVLVSFDSLYNARNYMKHEDIVHVETPPLKVGDVVDGFRTPRRIVAICGDRCWVTVLDGDWPPVECRLDEISRAAD